MADSIALFPLHTVLFPEGTIALQLFEPRYLDLIKRCMREDTGFGVVCIRAGSELISAASSAIDLVEMGTYARIVDWDALDNGLLGIVARGTDKFRILDVATQADKLVVAEVEFMPAEPPQALPGDHLHLAELLRQLLAHPSVAPRHAPVNYESALTTGNLLSQLLPVSLPAKYDLLCCTGALQRLQLVDALVAELGGSDAPAG